MGDNGLGKFSNKHVIKSPILPLCLLLKPVEKDTSTHTKSPNIAQVFLGGSYLGVETSERLEMSLLSPPPPPPPLLVTPYGSTGGGDSSVSIDPYVPLIVTLIIIAALMVASLVFANLCVKRWAFFNSSYATQSFVKQECGMCTREGTIDVAYPVMKGNVENVASEELVESDPPQNEEDDEDGSSEEGF